jgi:hypothetical protein
MGLDLDGSGMIAVFPESPSTGLSLLERLGSRRSVGRLGRCLLDGIRDQQMDMVGCNHVIGNLVVIALPGRKQPVPIAPMLIAISRSLADLEITKCQVRPVTGGS